MPLSLAQSRPAASRQPRATRKAMRLPCARLWLQGQWDCREQVSTRRRRFRVAGCSVPGLSPLSLDRPTRPSGALRIRAASEHYLIMYHVSIGQGGEPTTSRAQKASVAGDSGKLSTERMNGRRNARPVSRGGRWTRATSVHGEGLTQVMGEC
ncbi:hypothetical protein PMIN01_04289 [Paraphaeosphaeria minitans]|uniref:Uncharacterized protein n=1 Tax=Paraphaeosphaeria minitans TaxID=565426 RepID=A0A9P6KRT9_9PLEO|nr:hypothetical protein PMIN01_04289 [Paraphaeosphaeria minitans]